MDYVAMLTISITTIIDGISYVLIAFVSISLVVSSTSFLTVTKLMSAVKAQDANKDSGAGMY